jgi:hypothetical protein
LTDFTSPFVQSLVSQFTTGEILLPPFLHRLNLPHQFLTTVAKECELYLKPPLISLSGLGVKSQVRSWGGSFGTEYLPETSLVSPRGATGEPEGKETETQIVRLGIPYIMSGRMSIRGFT